MRYFNFSYRFYGSVREGFGQLLVINQSKSFPSKTFLKKVMEIQIKEKYPNQINYDIVILGWNEMSKSDYDDFTKEN